MTGGTPFSAGGRSREAGERRARAGGRAASVGDWCAMVGERAKDRGRSFARGCALAPKLGGPDAKRGG